MSEADAAYQQGYDKGWLRGREDLRKTPPEGIRRLNEVLDLCQKNWDTVRVCPDEAESALNRIYDLVYPVLFEWTAAKESPDASS
jgi:hypothetical protein